MNLFVEYIKENPDATNAYIDPAIIPFTVDCANNELTIVKIKIKK
tara:strand:+ start:118 stop:252 length:135 start_codon:yes stop_codon:yes gene_type:complete